MWMLYLMMFGLPVEREFEYRYFSITQEWRRKPQSLLPGPRRGPKVVMMGLGGVLPKSDLVLTKRSRAFDLRLERWRIGGQY